MYHFWKCPNPANFASGKAGGKNSLVIGKNRFKVGITGTTTDVYRISVENKSLWPKTYSRSELSPPRSASHTLIGKSARFKSGPRLAFSLVDNAGDEILSTLPQAFGTCGNGWLFQFKRRADMQFYGMGEKSTPFEKSNKMHRFWNTDSWGDFGSEVVATKEYDPDYIAIPYLIIKRANRYTGILIDNPFPSFISTTPLEVIAQQKEAGSAERSFYLGAEGGPPVLYIIHGPSLGELTRKFQKLTGTSPLPPLWSLGHHQCRWGYAGIKDLKYLADNFKKQHFPVDGLWLDIDYMDGYRVFTTNKKHFPGLRKNLKNITDRGHKVVPIIDPGIKQEKGYAIYDEGERKNLFCRNRAGIDFVGMVWPGKTVFPDFTLPQTRTWWAAHFAQFLRSGFAGAWLDMNDPSTGSVECVEMLFAKGKVSHEAFHNQYALLMAKASREGCLLANPNKRPFLLSRSGSTGSQKFAANWCGDNLSNYYHLKMSIPKCLNLSLSGMPFIGVDIGGFGGDTTEQLMIDWYKAGFLLPFSRNHSIAGSRRQEPWQFSRKALGICRHFIRLRYKLLPYLYNLFIDHEQTGEAIMRPLFYDFADKPSAPLSMVDDQFMIGPGIMQAPFVTEKERTRSVVLPAGWWYRADTGEWIRGGRTISVDKKDESTPVFIPDGSIIPMQKGACKTNKKDLRDIELHLFFMPGSKTFSSIRYIADDGETFAYKKNVRSEYLIKAVVRGRSLHLETKALNERFGSVRFTPVVAGSFERVVVSTNGIAKEVKARAVRRQVFSAG